VVRFFRGLHHGWSQEQLAARIGVEPGTYSRYETGTRRISLDLLGRVAAALGVPASAIFGDDKDAVPRGLARTTVRPVRKGDEKAVLRVWARLKPRDRKTWLGLGRELDRQAARTVR
jgi:transcriptional regulator with XRE-family HTH domain